MSADNQQAKDAKAR